METMDLELIQGTKEWLNLRKTKITSTDAAVIMGVSPWKSKLELYYEKISEEPIKLQEQNYYMKRGSELEPMARDLYSIMSGYDVEPKVVISHWSMASLDGIDKEGKYAVEIKCPGFKAHQTALDGKVPDYYYPQLQHIIWVCNLDKIDYFSFDGTYGVIVEVKRDCEYLQNLIREEYEFYMCIKNKTPPKPTEKEYVFHQDEEWEKYALKWTHIDNSMKQLEKEVNEIENQLILLAGSSNAKGAGISLSQVTRKGNIDYTKVPELNGVDLEPYRKESTTSWRIKQI